MNGMSTAIKPRSGSKSNFGYKLLDWLMIAVISLGLAALILFVILSPLSITDPAVTGFEDGDLVFADRFGKYLFGLDRGDIVLLKHAPSEEAQSGERLARVAAFAGEKVIIAEGKVYIDGALLDESAYSQDLHDSILSEFIVPTGCVFVLPDKRMMITKDSLDRLVVELPSILGEVRFIAYPFGRFTSFK